MSVKNFKRVEVLIRILDYVIFAFGVLIGVVMFQALGNWKYLFGILIGLVCRKMYLLFALNIVKNIKNKEMKSDNESN